MTKSASIACVVLFMCGVTLAQQPESKNAYYTVKQLTAGPGDAVDSMADLSLEAGERDRLGSLGPERLDTLLREALNLRNPCAAVELLEAGANPNGIGRSRGLPLWYASVSLTDDTVRLLLLYGADVNLVPIHGNSALMRAARNGRSATVQALLDAGADVNCWDREGKTALDYAEAGNHEACAEMLRHAPY